MPAFPFNPSYLTWNPAKPHSGGSFRPQGRLTIHGQPDRVHHNPEGWDSKETIAGRLIVGFNVGKRARWKLADLVRIVKRVRLEQSGDPSSTFVSQKGIYKHVDGTGIVTENGAQVFIATDTSSLADFRKQMVELGEIIAREMKQETVIVEIQVNGVTQVTIGVIP